MVKILIVSLVLVISGCASKPSLNTTPLNISESKAPEYWSWPNVEYGEFQVILDNGECYSFEANFNNSPKVSENYLKVEFLIDSNGNQFEHKVVENKGGPIYNWVESMTLDPVLPGRKYQLTPSEDNKERNPILTKRSVFVSKSICFDQSRKDKKFGKMGISYYVDTPKPHRENITFIVQQSPD
jgi:hypothetical protein